MIQDSTTCYNEISNSMMCYKGGVLLSAKMHKCQKYITEKHRGLLLKTE